MCHSPSFHFLVSVVALTFSTDNSRVSESSSSRPITIQQRRQPRSSSQSVLITPPDEYAQNEVDFTVRFAKKPQPQAKPEKDSPPSMGTSPGLEGEGCGFCTDESNCACKAVTNLQSEFEALERDEEVSSKVSGPGTCDMCIADPEKAKQCQELARKARFDAQNASSQREDVQMTDLPAPTQPSDRMSCSDLLNKIDPSHRTSSLPAFGEVFGRLHAYPYGRANSSTQHAPAMEFETAEAAVALASLSRMDS